MDIISNYADNLYKKIVNDSEEDLIKFLRKNGYRPKKTEKYINNLQKKLKKQNLCIVYKQKEEFDYKNNYCIIKNEFYFDKIIKNKEQLFLKEYEKLCQKYKIGLKGCGCCGSPYLNDINEINYNEKFNKIIINGQGYQKENPNDYENITEYYIDEYFEKKVKS